MNNLCIFLGFIFLSTGCAHQSRLSNVGAIDKEDILEISKVPWENLNPARGKKSPKAGTLFGNRKGAVPTGFLAEFEDGFSSPPHIHNVSYRGIVIQGEVHNDDPHAKNMWMPVGSFWTQPAGAAHITSAKGSRTRAYIEIDRGPYLVKPTKAQFDNGERPINVHRSNLTWTPIAGDTGNGTALAHLWRQAGSETIAGKRKTDRVSHQGDLLKWPYGVTRHIEGDSQSLRWVVVSGSVAVPLAKNERASQTLNAGSFFKGKSANVKCLSKPGCLLFLGSSGTFFIR